MTKPTPTTTKRITCDHPDCISPPEYYGYQQCYFVCAAHTEWGEAIERRVIAEFENAQESSWKK